MKDLKTKVILVLAVLIVGQFLIGKYKDNKAHARFVKELTQIVSERDSIQVHAEGLYSQWAYEKDELELKNEKLEKLAKELELEVTTKSRVILKQKKIIQELQATAEVITDSTGSSRDKVNFSLHKDGVKVTGYTLNPPPSAYLEVEHDPIQLDIHIAKTKSGSFTKGLLEGPPWLNVQEWNLVIHNPIHMTEHPSLWTQLKRTSQIQVGAYAGPGGYGIPVTVGALNWNAGVIVTEEGISYLLSRTFKLSGG